MTWNIYGRITAVTQTIKYKNVKKSSKVEMGEHDQDTSCTFNKRSLFL